MMIFQKILYYSTLCNESGNEILHMSVKVAQVTHEALDGLFQDP